MNDKVRVWYDPDADYLEVVFSDGPYYMRPTGNDALMKRVDEEDHVIGFSVFGLGRFRKDHPVEADLAGER